MSTLTERFDAIAERVATALSRAGRKAGEARLIAVSKLHGADAVAELARHWHMRPDMGGPVFGESYMQEGREKMPAVAALLAAPAVPASRVAPVPLEWHFIGHVQSRKAKDIAGQYALVHSVDSLKLAGALARAWQERVADAPLGPGQAAPQPQAVLVQVNVGREPQKSGVAPEGLEELLNSIASLPGIALQGLMCLPPLAEIGAASRPYFALLRTLRDDMEQRCGVALPHLSMGMSGDFEAAIEEGATLVRIGTDIFGPRVQ